jgi:surface protein
VANWNVENVEDLSYTFYGCSSLKTIPVNNWNVENVEDLSYTFAWCSSLKTIPIDNWNTRKVRAMKATFTKCTSLESLNISNWDLSSCETIYTMFSMNNYGENPPPITELDVSKWNVSNIKEMGWAFYGLAKLKELHLDNWDVSKVEGFHHCFAHCHNLILHGIEHWDMSSVKTTNAMLHGTPATFYDLSKWNVSNVENMGQMFENCYNLVSIKGLEKWNTSNCKSFSEMFARCFCGDNGFHLNGDFKKYGVSLFHYRPFTIEANYCFCDVLQDMLLEDKDEFINAFSCVPYEWTKKEFSFNNFLCRGGYYASAKYNNGKIVEFSLRSKEERTVKIKNNFGFENLSFSNGAVINCKKGDIFELTFKGEISLL